MFSIFYLHISRFKVRRSSVSAFSFNKVDFDSFDFVRFKPGKKDSYNISPNTAQAAATPGPSSSSGQDKEVDNELSLKFFHNPVFCPQPEDEDQLVFK